MDCVYCRKDVPENKIRFFLRVLLCDDCYTLASDARDFSLKSLETVRAMLDKTLQDRLVRRESISPSLSLMWDAHNGDTFSCQTTKHPQPSSASSTKLLAITAGGSESSSKLLVADSRSETESSPETGP